MADEKVYYPTEIQDQPLPQQSPVSLSASQTSTKDNYNPSTIQDQPLPRKIIARETIGSALNTKSRKIMNVFAFTQMGAIKIGTFQLGISGEVSISPLGIIGEDQSGLVTFAIDAETGDAVFRGKLLAGTLIAGDGNVVIDESSNGNGRIVLYNDGIPSIVIGDPS